MLAMVPSGFFNRTSTAESSCSTSAELVLDIFTPHAGAQTLQGAELQLFHRSLAASQLVRDFAYRPLIDEPANDDLFLIGGQTLHQLRQDGPLFDGRVDAGLLQFVGGDLLPFSLPSPAIRQHFGGDAQQPRRKRCASPLKTLNAG